MSGTTMLAIIVVLLIGVIGFYIDDSKSSGNYGFAKGFMLYLIIALCIAAGVLMGETF
ncbi:hypothetical protein OMP38_14600 [Cohnella ginsengisoli]|uniref:Uncharacterized protein n=1 Tax=Cohnella ginsengisoli TaxID=425004 RepID=A0A9X4QN34_9BACL|nr:hypothetical protein [Cohnella ginsengisoli]MDG0791947.1 hypothetical protein [Cohnella ginsengisoli]